MATQAPDDSQIPTGEPDSMPKPAAQQVAATCPNCGAGVQEGMVYCPACGAKIQAGEATEPQTDVEKAKDLVGEIKTWTTMDIALDGWEYRIWEKWIKSDVKTAKLLLDNLQQWSPDATMSFERSKTKPDSPDFVVVYRFSLYGAPDDLQEAITSILGTFIGASENYKIIAGKAKAFITYSDGTTDEYRANVTQGTDIDEALRMILDRANKAIGSKGEQKKEEEDVIKEVPCPECEHFGKNSKCSRCNGKGTILISWDGVAWRDTVEKNIPQDQHIFQSNEPTEQVLECPVCGSQPPYNAFQKETCEYDNTPYVIKQKKEAKLACPNCERPALVASFNSNLLCQRCGWYGTEERIKVMWAIQADLKKPWPTVT